MAADVQSAKADAATAPDGTSSYEVQFVNGYRPAFIEVVAGDTPVTLFFATGDPAVFEDASGKTVAAAEKQPWPNCNGQVSGVRVDRGATGTGARIRWQ